MDQEVESFDLTNGDTVLPKSSRGVLDLCSAGDLESGIMAVIGQNYAAGNYLKLWTSCP